MPMILSGGGGVAKNPSAYELFASCVDKRKPVLYISLASLPDSVYDAYGRFAVNMAALGIYSTRLCNRAEMFDEFELEDCGGIYCAGGNTFRLLKALKDSGADEKIRRYVKNGGAYIGSSAGAIIAGADILPIIFMDSNAVLLKDTRGLDMMRGWSTIAHYGNASTDTKNQEWFDVTEKLAAEYDKLIALSEESAVVIEDDRAYIIGAECKVYEGGTPRILCSGDTIYQN